MSRGNSGLIATLIDPVRVLGVNKGANIGQAAFDPAGLRQFIEPTLPKYFRAPNYQAQPASPALPPIPTVAGSGNAQSLAVSKYNPATAAIVEAYYQGQ